MPPAGACAVIQPIGYGCPACRGAGRPAAGRDAGRPRGSAGAGVRGGHRGDRRAAAVDFADLIRSDPRGHDDLRRRVDGHRRASPCLVGSRFELGGQNLSSLTPRTGRPTRIEAYVDVTGPIGTTGAHGASRSSVGVPIIVEGRPVGPDGRLAYARDQQPAGGYRGAPDLVHRVGGDRGRQRREPCRARPAGRGAGRAAAGRDAGGARGGAGAGVRGGHRGVRAAGSGRCGGRGALRA